MRSFYLGAFALASLSANASTTTTQDALPADSPTERYSPVISYGLYESRQSDSLVENSNLPHALGIVLGPRAVLTLARAYCPEKLILQSKPDARVIAEHLIPIKGVSAPRDCNEYNRYSLANISEWVVLEYSENLHLPPAKVDAPTVTPGRRDSFEAVFFTERQLGKNAKLRSFITHEGTRYGETDTQARGRTGTLKLDDWAYTKTNLRNTVRYAALLDVKSTLSVFHGFGYFGGTFNHQPDLPYFSNELTPDAAQRIKAIVQTLYREKGSR